jgi:hypothetical protein
MGRVIFDVSDTLRHYITVHKKTAKENSEKIVVDFMHNVALPYNLDVKMGIFNRKSKNKLFKKYIQFNQTLQSANSSDCLESLFSVKTTSRSF